MQFISHAHAKTTCEHLEKCILNSQISVLAGSVKTGKTRILQHVAGWHHKDDAVPPRIVYAQLWKPPSVRKYGYMTSIAGIAFTEITVGLSALSEQYSSPLVHETKRWYNRPRSAASDAQFASLFAFVRTELQRLRVSALIIDNASLLDSFTIERLFDCRRMYQNHLAIIFAETRENPAVDSHLTSLVETFSRADERYSAITLPRLTKRETSKVILPELINRYCRGLEEGLSRAMLKEIRDAFWDKVKGRWDEIAAVGQRLERTLGLTTPKSFLTKERWQNILEATYALREPQEEAT